jgi:hypothetical protein
MYKSVVRFDQWLRVSRVISMTTTSGDRSAIVRMYFPSVRTFTHKRKNKIIFSSAKRRHVFSIYRNDGPRTKYKAKDQIKLVLDMSNDGPTFKMLESLMAATSGGKNGGYDALNKLLSSGIPGMENLFSSSKDGKENFGAKYAKETCLAERSY